MKLSGELTNQELSFHFGGDPDHRLDQGFGFRIFMGWIQGSFSVVTNHNACFPQMSVFNFVHGIICLSPVVFGTQRWVSPLNTCRQSIVRFGLEMTDGHLTT